MCPGLWVGEERPHGTHGAHSLAAVVERLDDRNRLQPGGDKFHRRGRLSKQGALGLGVGLQPANLGVETLGRGEKPLALEIRASLRANRRSRDLVRTQMQAQVQVRNVAT